MERNENEMEHGYCFYLDRWKQTPGGGFIEGYCVLTGNHCVAYNPRYSESSGRPFIRSIMENCPMCNIDSEGSFLGFGKSLGRKVRDANAQSRR